MSNESAPVTPPDMVGAGMMQPAQPPMDLLGALRSQGNMPSGIMGALNAMGAGVFAGRGQADPVAAQQMQQQRMQMEQMQMMQRMQHQQQDLALRKQTALLPIYEGLLKSDSPEGRIVGARGMEQVLKSQGQQVSPGFAESFGSKLPSLDKRKEAYMSILAAKQDPALQAGLDKYLTQTLQIPADMLPMLKQEAGSDAVHKLFFGKTPAQEAAEVQKANRDQTRLELAERKQDALEAHQAKADARGEAQSALAARRVEIAEGHLRQAELRTALAEKRLEYMMAHGPEEKRQKALDQAELLANQMQAVAAQMNTDGYLPAKGISKFDPRYTLVVGKRKIAPFESSWQTWTKHLQPAMVGFARNVQGDMGPRAILAFQGVIGMGDSPPDIDSINEVVRNMRLAIKLGREGKDTASNVYIRKPTGQVLRVPWTRGMDYAPGDTVVKVE